MSESLIRTPTCADRKPRLLDFGAADEPPKKISITSRLRLKIGSEGMVCGIVGKQDGRLKSSSFVYCFNFCDVLFRFIMKSQLPVDM